MIPTDYDAFCQVVIGFAELKGKTLSAAAIELYWHAMQHWSLEDFKSAAVQLLRTSEFMPTPKSFEDLRKAGRPTAGEAWARVLEYARKGWSVWDGSHATVSGALPAPDDDLIDRTVRAIGGYEAIALSSVDATHFLERRFCEHYESIQDAQEIREALPQLTAPAPGKRLQGPASIQDLLPSTLEGIP
jgi:hypothetical protein